VDQQYKSPLVAVYQQYNLQLVEVSLVDLLASESSLDQRLDVESLVDLYSLLVLVSLALSKWLALASLSSSF